MKFHGILTIEDRDSLGDTVVVAGTDVGPLRERALVSLNFDSDAANVVGRVTAVVPVLDPGEETDPELQQLAGGKPFIKIEVDIPGMERTKGRELLQALQLSDPGTPWEGRAFTFGIGGTVLKKEEVAGGGSIIRKCVVKEVVITQHGVHPAQRVIAGPLKTG